MELPLQENTSYNFAETKNQYHDIDISVKRHCKGQRRTEKKLCANQREVDNNREVSFKAILKFYSNFIKSFNPKLKNCF